MGNIFEGRRIICFCALFFLIFALSVFSESPPPGKKFELKLSGGINRLSGTDSEDATDFRNHLLKISTEAAGGIFTSEKDPLDWGGEFEGQIIFNLSSRFALSGGVGYITGKYTSKRVSTLEGVTTGSSGIDQTAMAVPVTAGLYYSLPVSSKSRFSLVAGAGYYFASFASQTHRENDTPYRMDTDTTGSGGDIGFFGGIEFEYSLSNNVAIVIEGFGRYAKISGFEGTRNRIDSNNWSDSLDGTHYHFEQFAWSGEWRANVNISAEPPSGEDIRNVRDFELDFSGFTIRAGLKIKLF